MELSPGRELNLIARGRERLLTMLEDGRLHLSGIAVLAPHLTFANCEELLARATHKTKREILVLVAEMAPKPDVPPSIRKLPQRRQKPASENRASGAENTPSGKSCLAPEPRLAPEATDKPPVVEPLAPARYKVQFTASAEFHYKPSFQLFPDRVQESPPLRGAVPLATTDGAAPRAVF